MTKLKKIIGICTLFFIIILLNGCTSKHQHVFDQWEIKTDATEDMPGFLVRKCNQCGEIEEKMMSYEFMEELVNEAIDNALPIKEIKNNIEFIKEYKGVKIKWVSKNTYYLSHEGEVKNRGVKDRVIPLEATFTYHNIEVVEEYEIKILALSDDEKIELAKEKIVLPESINEDIELITDPGYNVKVSYESNNPEYLTNDGRVNLQSEEKVVTIKVIYETETKKEEETREIKIEKYVPIINRHQIIHRPSEFDLSNTNDLILKDNRIQLKDGIVKGIYTSNVIEIASFYSLVASWSALSSVNATCEIKVSARVDGVWSDYVTYRPWGLGLENKSVDQANDLIEISYDEVIILNNKQADAFKYQIIFERDNITTESSKLSLISFALKLYNYTYKVTTGALPEKVDYEVPELNQNVVPTIGNIICSATSTTMLLKYHGFDFTTQDAEYEHRYVASLVKDYRGIYGNWVFNVATMGAFGLDAYVARMYSTEELMYHLATVGPVSITVGGQMTSDVANYYTNGHLLVCRGYEILEDGSVNFLCNDPNVKNVACKYTEAKIKQTWGGIVYVIENQKLAK